MNNLKPFEKLKIYEEELQQSKNRNDLPETLTCLRKLGKLCCKIKANELGLKYIEEALTLGTNQPDFTDRYIFYQLLGDLYFEDGNIKEAHNLYIRSNNEMPKNQDLEFKVKNYFKIAKVSRLLGKSTEHIVKVYLKAAKISSKLKNFGEVAKSYEKIGVLYLDKAEAHPYVKVRTSMYKTYTQIYNPYRTQWGKIAINYWTNALKILENYNLQKIETELYSALQSHLKFAFERLARIFDK